MLVHAGDGEFDPLGQVDRVVADALEILRNHQQIQCNLTLAGFAGNRGYQCLLDIGKILIPDEILSKPDRLTDNEFAIMKNHVNLGYAKIKDEDLDSRIKEACLLHHEKCDGSGYPFGLPSDQIPDFTKIVTIADVYDAMTCERVYRDSICPFEVIKIMESEAYTKYDPKFILPFLRNVVTSYIHTNVKLSDGRICEVVMINRDNLSLPVVKCGEQFIDLSKEKGIKIVAVL